MNIIPYIIINHPSSIHISEYTSNLIMDSYEAYMTFHVRNLPFMQAIGVYLEGIAKVYIVPFMTYKAFFFVRPPKVFLNLVVCLFIYAIIFYFYLLYLFWLWLKVIAWEFYLQSEAHDDDSYPFFLFVMLCGEYIILLLTLLTLIYYRYNFTFIVFGYCFRHLC